MSGYTECSIHGYYDNDNGCPECQDEQESFALRERDLWKKQCLEAESKVKALEAERAEIVRFMLTRNDTHLNFYERVKALLIH